MFGARRRATGSTALRTLLTEILEFSAKPGSMVPALQRPLGGHGPWSQFLRRREQTDALIFELIDERRRAGEARDDVLSMLLDARHEDGTPMSSQELRDELMTLLVAGHETTASELAWAFERLPRDARRARAARRRDRLGRRRGLPDRDGPRDPAPPPGAARRRSRG